MAGGQPGSVWTSGGGLASAGEGWAHQEGKQEHPLPCASHLTIHTPPLHPAQPEPQVEHQVVGENYLRASQKRFFSVKKKSSV